MKAAYDKRQTFQQKVWLHNSCMQQSSAEVLSWPVHTIQYAVVLKEAACCCRKSENGILGKPRAPKTMWRKKRGLRGVLACIQALIPKIAAIPNTCHDYGSQIPLLQCVYMLGAVLPACSIICTAFYTVTQSLTS